MNEMKLSVNELPKYLKLLHAGDRVLLSGVIYTARDAAHKRLVSLLSNGEALPFDLKGAVIYYAGPTPAKSGLAVGSIGPTTSSRMDSFAPTLIENGLLGMIGKGARSDSVVEAMKKHGAVYFAAIGGAGALYSRCIKKCEVVAFDELGCESVKRLTVENFPLTVATDSFGETLYK